MPLTFDEEENEKKLCTKLRVYLILLNFDVKFLK